MKFNNLENLKESNLTQLASSFHNIKFMLQYINFVFGKWLFGLVLNVYDISIFLGKVNLIKLAYFLKNHNTFMFYLIDLVIIDRPAKKKRFEVIYLLLSYSKCVRINLHVFVNEFDFLLSLSELYPSALWLERESWDLFGVIFKKHPDLRRLLTDYGFVGYPMRKDFPLTGHFEIFYSDLLQRLKKTRVILMQEYRYYDFLKIW